MAVTKLHTIPAHYPRAHESSTLTKGQRPSLVFCEWVFGVPVTTAESKCVCGEQAHKIPRIDKEVEKAGADIEEFVEYGKPVAPRSKVNILFLHGIGHSKEIWHEWIAMLEQETREHIGHVVGLDLINHGDSWLANADKLGWFLDWSDLGRDACEVMRHVDTESKWILIGHSMGGTTALFAALFEPGLVDSCIVLDPMCYKALVHKTPLDIIRQGRRMSILESKLKSTFSSEAEFWHYFRTAAPCRKTLPSTLDFFLKANIITDPCGSVHFKTPKEQQLLAFHGVYSIVWTALDAFKSIRCPIAHVFGVYSTWTHPETVPIIRDALNCVRIDIDGDHFFPFEHPHKTFTAVKPFLLSRLCNRRPIRAIDRDQVNPAIRRAFDRYADGITQLPAKL